jgi:aminomuconate-semialdehyde/2-hydroxymuconate-6-semialdehyde dehydrogenase
MLVGVTVGSILNYVGGRFVEGAAGFDDVNPVDGSVVARVHEADAVHAARTALEGPYGDSSVAARVGMLRRAADIVERRFDDLLAAELADTGKPHGQARVLDVARAATNLRSFADTAAAAGVPSFLTDLADGRQALNYAYRKPLGVVAVIVPWNLPLLLLTWKLAPAIACGNAVVVKPSEETPGSATLLAEILDEAGVPAGVYNVVHGFGEDSAGQFLTEHSDIDGVTFTGSTATGTGIMRAVAARVRPVSFELGGKNAALVFADADLDAGHDDGTADLAGAPAQGRTVCRAGHRSGRHHSRRRRGSRCRGGAGGRVLVRADDLDGAGPRRRPDARGGLRPGRGPGPVRHRRGGRPPTSASSSESRPRRI